MSAEGIRVRLLLAAADGGPALVGLHLPSLRPIPPEPGTPLLVLSAEGMRTAAADPGLVRVAAVLHLGRLPARRALADVLKARPAPETIAAAVAAALDPDAPGEGLARRVADAGPGDLAELQLRHLLHRMAAAPGGWRLRRIQQALLHALPAGWRPDVAPPAWETRRDDAHHVARALAGAPHGEPLTAFQALAADAATALAMLVQDPRRILRGRDAPAIRDALLGVLDAVAALLPPGHGALAPEDAQRVAATLLLTPSGLLADGPALLILTAADLKPLGGDGTWIQRVRLEGGRLRADGAPIRPDPTVLSMTLGRGRAMLFSEDRRLEIARLLDTIGLGGLAPERCILLDRLAADLGRPVRDLAAFGDLPDPLPPGTSPVQAASAAVRRGLAALLSPRNPSRTSV